MPRTQLTIEDVRSRNLAHLLELLHLRGPLSRAALTEATGLYRSTTADLVAELEDRGLVRLQAPDATRRVGRPSPVITIAPGVVAIAVHPEVDAVTIAAVGLDGAICARVRIENDDLPTAPEVAARVAAQIEQWRSEQLGDAEIVGIGVAVPGLVRTDGGIVSNAPHLKWKDAPVQQLLASATGIPTAVGNDATLGAQAEHLFGAGREVADMIYLNGGASGIGGGIVVGGMPWVGAGGFAGEFGQNRLWTHAEKPASAPETPETLETHVNRARLLAVLGLATADEPTLGDAIAASDDTAVVAEVSRQRALLAVALANAANALNPSLIVLGGFLATLAALDAAGLTESVRAAAMPEIGAELEVRIAALGEDRLLIGAAEIAFAPLLRGVPTA